MSRVRVTDQPGLPDAGVVPLEVLHQLRVIDLVAHSFADGTQIHLVAIGGQLYAASYAFSQSQLVSGSMALNVHTSPWPGRVKPFRRTVGGGGADAR